MRWLVLLFLLISAPAYASPQLLFLAATGGTGTAFTINGYSSISSAGTLDTGTESISTDAGNITIYASCTDNTAGVGGVDLYVDGSVRASQFCNGTGQSKSGTLSHTVTAGLHDVRIVGSGDPGVDFVASDFKKP